jgi:hypothetical protein
LKVGFASKQVLKVNFRKKGHSHDISESMRQNSRQVSLFDSADRSLNQQPRASSEPVLNKPNVASKLTVNIQSDQISAQSNLLANSNQPKSAAIVTAKIAPPNPELSENASVVQKVKADFFRLAAFAANLCEAHSAFIFLPYDALCALIGKAPPAIIEERKALVMAGFQSLSKDSILPNCRLPSGFGIIGWAARHRKAVQVSPFHLDVKTLGIYSDNQELKSFTARPIMLSPRLSLECGVLVCDSKKTYAFSRVHERLLDNIGLEISNTADLLLDRQRSEEPMIGWSNFSSKANQIKESLGENSIEMLRVSISQSNKLEALIGTQEFITISEQLYRLTLQAIPANVPVLRLINGDIIICLDSMMSSFYESRLKAVCDRALNSRVSLQLSFRRASPRDKNLKGLSISELVAATSLVEMKVNDKELKYGNS